MAVTKGDAAAKGVADTRAAGAPAREDATAAPGSLAASVGLTDADLVEMYRYVALARALDERMWILNRAGRIPFVISGQGHEGAQVGIAWAFQRGHDWIAPFYRSIATCLTFGMSPRDILTAQYATANDPSSGGRQMPGHYGSHEHNLVSVSSPVATQLLHAVGIALAAKVRKTGQVAMTSMGEGSSNQGDVHEGLNFAAIHKLPFIFVVENNGYAISVPAAMQVSMPNVADRASGDERPRAAQQARRRDQRGGQRRIDGHAVRRRRELEQGAVDVEEQCVGGRERRRPASDHPPRARGVRVDTDHAALTASRARRPSLRRWRIAAASISMRPAQR